jgi:hypothetical protein
MWSPKQFDFADPLNQIIWTESVRVQGSIQLPEDLCAPGSVGAQQAMVGDGDVLPWVPDLVGKRCNDVGLAVVGCAYAGFIREYSLRTRTLPLSDYSAAKSAADFQEKFFNMVVVGDDAYYSKIQQLADGHFSPDQLLIFDLCRASLVRRGTGTENRGDSSSTLFEDDDACRIYAHYAEHPCSESWTFDRLASCRSGCVVTLGRIAEHGVLRLLTRRLSCGSIERAGFFREFQREPFDDGVWVGTNAEAAMLPVNPGTHTWWKVCGRLNGQRRCWRILPAYHPACNDEFDSDYGAARSALGRMMESCC